MDSNLVIYYLGQALSAKAEQFIGSQQAIISVITSMEVLGWHGATVSQISRLQSFVDKARVLPLTRDIVETQLPFAKSKSFPTPSLPPRPWHTTLSSSPAIRRISKISPALS